MDIDEPTLLILDGCIPLLSKDDYTIKNEIFKDYLYDDIKTIPRYLFIVYYTICIVRNGKKNADIMAQKINVENNIKDYGDHREILNFLNQFSEEDYISIFN